MKVTLNIELFILVMHFDHFLKGCNNVNSCLKLKHDLPSQIPDRIDKPFFPHFWKIFKTFISDFLKTFIPLPNYNQKLKPMY